MVLNFIYFEGIEKYNSYDSLFKKRIDNNIAIIMISIDGTIPIREKIKIEIVKTIIIEYINIWKFDNCLSFLSSIELK